MTKHMAVPAFDRKWARQVEQDYQALMDMLAEAAMDGDVVVDTPSGIPSCGCNDCLTRETFAFFLPRIVHAVREGLVQ